MRYITTWRSKENVLMWEHCVSEDLQEADRVVQNIKKQGIIQYHTYELGNLVTDLSVNFNKG